MNSQILCIVVLGLVANSFALGGLGILGDVTKTLPGGVTQAVPGGVLVDKTSSLADLDVLGLAEVKLLPTHNLGFIPTAGTSGKGKEKTTGTQTHFSESIPASQSFLIKSINTFFILGGKANWYDANKYCNSIGARLAIVDTTQKLSDISKYFITKGYTNQRFWIGATDLGKEGHFVWAPSGVDMVFKHFSANEPNNQSGDENCLGLWKPGSEWLMNDFNCKKEEYYICQLNVPRIAA